jgi:hypothetical protein
VIGHKEPHTHIDTSPQSVRYITLRSGGCIHPLNMIPSPPQKTNHGISSIMNLTLVDTPFVTRLIAYGAHITRLTPNVFFPPT